MEGMIRLTLWPEIEVPANPSLGKYPQDCDCSMCQKESATLATPQSSAVNRLAEGFRDLVEPKMFKVLIVDDSAIFRCGIKHILSAEFGLVEATEVAPLSGTLDLTAGPWRLVIVTVEAYGCLGLECLAVLRNTYPDQNVLVMASRSNISHVESVVKKPVWGPIDKGCTPDELVRAVRQAIEYSKPPVSDELQSDLTDNSGDTSHEVLSKRELEVLRLTAAGKNVKEISVILDVAVNTISTYRVRLLRKLKLKNTAELIRYAFLNNLAD